jgi:hypothetical protein
MYVLAKSANTLREAHRNVEQSTDSRPRRVPTLDYPRSAFNFCFFIVSSGLTAMPSAHRRSCATVMMCVVAGART